MAKQMKIIGNCPFCDREVGSDLRPINQLNLDQIDMLAQKLKDDKAEAVSDASDLSLSDLVDKVTNVKSKERKSTSVSILTETMLNMVRNEFERKPDAESIPEDHAELVMAMLTEEQHSYNRFLMEQASTKQKRGVKRRRT